MNTASAPQHTAIAERRTTRHPEMNLRNLQDYTPHAVAQEVFSRLLEQGRPSLDGRSCMYRAHDGAKCAVGLLLDDLDYTPDMERTSASSVVSALGLVGGLGRRGHSYTDLLDLLQTVHDNTRHLSLASADFLSVLRLAIDASGVVSRYERASLHRALTEAAAERGLAVAA